MPSRLVEKTCPTCGALRMMRRDTTHCSRRCAHLGKGKHNYTRGKAPRDHRECPQCGQIKLILLGSTYCSNTCAGTALNQVGEDNPNWRDGEVGYFTMHARVGRARGKASEQMCACGKQAEEWASTGHPGNVQDYVAMCRGCHRPYDVWQRATFRDLSSA